ncbi:hypothetical protein [Hyalangium minutum]|uniref:hypothetical protein n=1 Tax=Hyalangium minutum TaxID=394096 RepID=UPI0005C5AFBD|nr:hypothetical protein [Hyalangium minutum]
MDYLGLVFAFVGGLIGIWGKTTNDGMHGLRRLTTIGWVAIASVVVGAGVQGVMTYQNNADKRAAAIQAERLKLIALTMLERSVAQAVEPILAFKDGLQLQRKRYQYAAIARDSGAMDWACAIDLNDKYPSWGKSEVTHGQAATSLAKLSSEWTDDALTRYAQYLDPETVVMAEEFRHGLFLGSIEAAETTAKAFTKLEPEWQRNRKALLGYCHVPDASPYSYKAQLTRLARFEGHLRSQMEPLEKKYGDLAHSMAKFLVMTGWAQAEPETETPK